MMYFCVWKVKTRKTRQHICPTYLYGAGRSLYMQNVQISDLPSEDRLKTSLGMKSLSSAERAQSFMPLLPFIGKLMSLDTADTGSRWILITNEGEKQQEL